jgi:hypothetical protein
LVERARARESERGETRRGSARLGKEREEKTRKRKKLQKLSLLTWNCITRSLNTGPNSLAQPVMIRWRSFSRSLGRTPTRPVWEMKVIGFGERLSFFFSLLVLGVEFSARRRD